MKAGDIGFLTMRKGKPFYRTFISFMIALLTKLPNEKLSKTKVHSFVIYEKNSDKYVRDMDKDGDEHYLLDDYLLKYSGRIEIREYPYKVDEKKLKEFNYSCEHSKVRYDYMNTFIYQVVRRLIGVLMFKKTIYARMCAEDVQRQLNILNFKFSTPEMTNPAELSRKTNNWITIYE